MYNLNVDLATSAANAVNSLLVESTSTTPRTPEILNSLIAMTNPLDNYNFGDEAPRKTPNGPIAGRNGALNSMSSDSNSSSSSQVESPTTNPPSVQHTCSQLIKAGLKLTIEQKRKQQSDGEDLFDMDKVKRIKKNDCSESEEDKIKQENELTPEDEERRRRRRERNKIAATKCRLKKRERTANLVHESETLETQNIDLKTQLQELQNQKRSLMEVLSLHRPQCQHNIGPVTRDHIYRLPPVSSVMETHSYSRPASGDLCFRSQVEVYSTRANIGGVSNITYSKSNYSKPPSIIVEEVHENYEFSEYTNLDTYPYNSPCHNYSENQNYSSTGLDNGCMA
ncbi:activating transcription factor 3 [Anoplophora glabripennis]|uniref:activating transcription factor 3 n=1 Tax=Anoplophora glabripennis TaxID=217634 RepID=UPI000874696A|nr:activating transcription factor 3 [Anoplophora glabripennis]